MKMKVYNVLDKKVKDAEVTKMDKNSVTYIDDHNITCIARWDLLFIHEALSFASSSSFLKVCRLVGMPFEDFDWSLIRDSDEDTLLECARILWNDCGQKMEGLELESAKMVGAQIRNK